MRNITLVSDEGMSGVAKKTHEYILQRGVSAEYAPIDVTTFANGEIKPKIDLNVRDKDVFAFYSMYPDPNAGVMNVALGNDALARASVDSISVVLPYLAYSRQDRKDQPRTPISSRVVADIIGANPKVERLLTFDLHCDQIQGFYQMPVENLYGGNVLQTYFSDLDLDKTVFVSPDRGGEVRTRRFAELFGDAQIGFVDKQRTGVNIAQVRSYAGADLKDKDVILFDDMCDTGGTHAGAAKYVLDQGAASVTLAVTHGIFSEKGGESALSKLEGLDVVIAETIPRSQAFFDENSHVTSVGIEKYLGDAIIEMSTPGGSVSKLQ